jgi:GNAT superfamily N-acetyltransferase
MVRVQPLTAGSLSDLDHLFTASKVCSGCWCMWFLLTSREFERGYGQANRTAFAGLVETGAPLGVLAYRDEDPVGWCAVGPRSRYQRLLRSPLLKTRDAAEDDEVWAVPCFFVRRDARGAGITSALLPAAVELGRQHGAAAVEGVPLAGPGPHNRMEAYVGTEAMFAAAGFRTRFRPSPRRAVVRREL